MDRSNDEPTAGTNSAPLRTTFETKPNVEPRSPQTPPRLQKKRSNAGARTTSQNQPPRSTITDQQDVGDTRDGHKARKGSLRNAVRRLFGRRSREVEQQPSQVTPPRHGYHRSEPYTVLVPPSEAAEGAVEEDFAHRTFSAPIGILPSPAVQRTRSPYAVEFPQSARLKPMNIGAPFSAPGSQLRRRKTLPSVLIAGPEAAAVAEAVGSDNPPPVPNNDDGTIGRAVSTSRGEKRRSRSADDLRQFQSDIESRIRSEDIRFWRESFQPRVLRASGFTVPPRDEEPADGGDDEQTPMPRVEDPFTTTTGFTRVSPPRRGLEVAASDVASPSAVGSQLSQDLEDRIARLEAGLQSFRGELNSIAADRNRRTVLIGGVPSPTTRRRASSTGRTASMLAETLQTDFVPSDYAYDYRDTLRPSTSPQPPGTPPNRYAGSSSRGPLTSHPPMPDDPFTTTPSPPRADSGNTGIGAGGFGQSQSQQPPQYTFRSLYEMLNDERSARRKLEMQMRGLREEIANLHYQVSSVSNVQSQRSSYYAAMDPQVGSSRLHALLQETESRPGTTESTQQGGRQGLAIDPRVVSRFSGSESDAAMAESTELETPYEEYQTPIDDSKFPFDNQAGTGARGDGAMF
jgi:hypothetical protein